MALLTALPPTLLGYFFQRMSFSAGCRGVQKRAACAKAGWLAPSTHPLKQPMR
jgi:hypothetical protein